MGSINKKYFMRKIIILILFFFGKQSFCQNFTIAAEKMNVLYLGVENPISFAVENTNNNSLIVKTNNGIIKKEENNYSVVPSILRPLKITIYKKENGKMNLIGKKEFRVKRIPNPVFRIGSGKRRQSVEEILSQEYVRAENEECGFLTRDEQIEKFKVTIIYKDTSIAKFEKNNVSNKIDNEIIIAFSKLKTGDEVLFTEIFGNYPWEKNLILNDEKVLIK